MYNRYIPQSDGSYRRDRVNEPAREPARPPQPQRPLTEPPKQDCVCKQDVPPCQKGQPCHRPSQPPRSSPPSRRQPQGIGSFLRQLLPMGFNTEDLLIVLLLLLMASDCPDDQNTALLTLVLYIFM